MRFAPTTFRPAFGRVLAVVVVGIVVLGLAGLALSGNRDAVLRYSWFPLFIGVAAWSAYWLPSVSVAEHAVTVRNVLSTVVVPWPAILRIDTKYALTLYVPGGKVTAWASPAPNRYASQVTMTQDAKLAARESGGGGIRPGDLLDSPSGAVAYVIRRHWEELRDDGLLDAGPEAASVQRTWHRGTIAALVVLLLATLAGILVP